MSVNCIDVSSFQGNIDWRKVKLSGVKYVILRSIISGLKTDSKFETNYKSAKEAGLKVGVYLYSYAKDSTYAKKEANALIKLLNKKEIDLPVFYDLETSYLRNANKSTVQNIANAFKNIVENYGYKFGIYCDESFYNSNSHFSGFDSNCNFWIAKYGKNDGLQHTIPNISHHLCCHQFSSNGKIDGISGHVDVNNWYGVNDNKISVQKESVSLNKDIKWNGKVSASKLNVRTYAGTENKTVSFSPLKKGTSVGVCDTVKDSKGSDWYYIKYKDKYGFVSSKYVSKKENDTYLKKSSKFMKIIYDKVVSIKCTHKSGAKTYKEMVEKRETTCGRTVSFVFQEAGLLKTGMLISHTDAVGGGTSNILKKKNTISKAMKGYENLDLKKCKVVYLGEKNFDSVPSKYKVPGVAFIQDSNVFMCAGKDDGRSINYSCNNDTNKQVKKDKNGVYRYYNDKMKDGYTFTSPILVAIVPNN